MMRLLVDIGNTNISIGIMDNHAVKHRWRLTTHMERTRDEYLVLLRGLIRDAGVELKMLDAAAMSCVVPPLLEPMRQSLNAVTESSCLTVEPGIHIGMKINYKLTSDVGADRIVNACAAKAFYGYPVIILDFGTATTFCVVNSHGEYCGGAIFPGIGTTSEALYSSASLLPRVAFRKPSRVVGQSTVESIQSGLFYGYIDMIEGMIRRIRSEYGDIQTVLATGGLGMYLQKYSPVISTFDPDLTLKGLDVLFDMNTGATGAEVW